MKINGSVIKVACLGLLFPALATPALSQVPQDPTVALELPKGNWSLVVHPVHPVSDDLVPVDIFRVRTHAKMGMAVTHAGLINHSSRGLIAVRLRWTLYLNSPTNRRMMAVGTTRLVILSQVLGAGDKALVAAPFISFADPLWTLITAPGKGLEGAFSIELAPFELQFEDGGSWFAGLPTPGLSDSEFEIGDVRVLSSGETGFQPCPDQTCVYDGRLQCYVCSSQPGFYCAPESCLVCNTGWCFAPERKSR